MTRAGVPTSSRLSQQVSKTGRRLYLDSRLHGFLGRMTSARAVVVVAIMAVVMVTRRLVLVLVGTRLRLRLLYGVRRHTGF